MYFLYRSPVTIKKESIVTRSIAKEGLSELKVLLHLRNRSPDIIESVVFTDKIPALATLIKEKKVGTIAPTKILNHQKKGTIIKWEFDVLEPFEERIISYKLSTKMTIVGGLSLPPAKIMFKTKKGTDRIEKSNKAQVSPGVE